MFFSSHADQAHFFLMAASVIFLLEIYISNNTADQFRHCTKNYLPKKKGVVFILVTGNKWSFAREQRTEMLTHIERLFAHVAV